MKEDQMREVKMEKNFLEEMKFELGSTDGVQDLTLWTLRQRAHRRRKPKQGRNMSYVT